MLKKNFLASDRCYANYKHDEKSLLKYEKACSEIFSEISYLNRKKQLEKRVKGSLKTMDFGRVNNL